MMTPKKKAPGKLMCEVCKKNEAVGVANCSLAQPVSHAYCKKCLQEQADPLWCFCAVLELVGLEHLAGWVNQVRSYKDGKYIGFEEVKQHFLQEGKKMHDQEAVRVTKEGLDLLMNQARILAMLPLEDWLEAFDRAEALAPILDPTLYRQYIYSGKGEIIVSIIKAALQVKKAVMDAQPYCRKELGLEV